MEYITAKEASQLIGVHTSRVYALLREGRLGSPKRVGNMKLIKKDAVMAHIERPPLAGNVKPCTVNNVTYPSQAAAAVALGVSREWVRQLVEKKGNNFTHHPTLETD